MRVTAQWLVVWKKETVPLLAQVLGKIQRPYSRKELCLLVWKWVEELPAVEENAFKTQVLVFLCVFKVD